MLYPIQAILAFLLLFMAVGFPAQAFQLQDDIATTDDQTSVMIDVLANDGGSGGRPMILTDARGPNCPGTVTFHRDGTVELDPDPVPAATQCTIEYDVRGTTQTGTVAVTVTSTGNGGGDPDYLGVPTEPFGGCVDYGTTPPSSTGDDAEKCCWRELLRAADGQTDLDWVAIDILKEQSNSLNKQLLCRAADYYSVDVRPAGAGLDANPGSRDWFFDDLTRMAQQGWMDDGHNGSGSNEILSPLYGSWHAAAYIAALDRARAENDTPLVQKLEGWLRTYWVMNSLTAHAGPLVQTTTITSTDCNDQGGGPTTHTVVPTPGQWNGLSVTGAGLRRLGNECVGDTPRGALGPGTQPAHYVTALALDWSPRRWNASNLGNDEYHGLMRLVLLLEGQDFLAANGGTVDLEEFSPLASRFGLSEIERVRLRDFVTSPTTDVELFEEILDYVERDDPWRPVAGCPMTFLRTTEGTLARFGVDGPEAGNWLQACNRNKPPIYAARVSNDGLGVYLSPGATTDDGDIGPGDRSERLGNQIVFNDQAENHQMDRPGGELIYRVEWTHENGFAVVENFPPPPPPTDQTPYEGTAQPLPGRLEAELFDVGGQDVAWSDTTPDENTATNDFRTDEGVDVQQDDPNRIYVTDIAAGEWLEYTVALTSAGNHALSVEYRSLAGAGTGQILFEIEGTSIAQIVTLPNLGDGWQHAHNFGLTGLTANEQILRVTMLTSGFELDALWLTPLGESQIPYDEGSNDIPGVIQAEHYDEGDPGDAYFDTTPWNIPQGNQFRADDWVDAHVVAGGPVVSWIADGEWLEYTLDVAEAGDYDVDVRYQSNAQGVLRLSIVNGTQTESTITVDLPDSGGAWWVETIPAVYVGADQPWDQRILRLDFDDATYSLDWLRFEDPTPPDPPEQPRAEVDYVYVPVDATNWPIPHADLIDNDTPAGSIFVEQGYGVTPVGLFVGELSLGETAYGYTPPSTAWDRSEFWYRIRHTQDNSLYDVGRVVLLPLDELPFANPDQFEVLPGGQITLFHSVLLANDDGSNLEFDGVESYPAGTLQELSNRVIYTAPANPTTDSFTYRLKDTHGNQAPTAATVTLIVTNELSAPVANDDFFFVAEKTEAGAWADIDVLDAEVLANDTSPVTADLEVGDQGNVSCGHLSQHHFLGWTFTVTAGCDQAEWTYTLTDTVPEPDLTDTATIRVDVVPAPVGGDDGFRTDFQQSVDLPFQALTANDDGFGLGVILLTPSITQPPAGAGTVTVLPNQKVRFIPADGFVGDATFTYQVRNDMAEQSPIALPPSWDVTSDPITVTVTVDPPDASVTDDTLLIDTGLSQVDLPFAALFLNDDPPTELEIVSFTQPAFGGVVQFSDRFRFHPDTAFWTAGEDQFTYTVRRVGGTGYTTTASVRLEAEPVCAGGFADDFEGTGLETWAHLLETGGTLSLAPEVAMQGAAGLRVDVQSGATAVRLGEQSLRGASHPVLSFWFDPGSIEMGEGQIHPIAASGDSLFLWFSKINGQYRTRLVTATDSTTVGTAWIDISDEPHHFRLEAIAADLDDSNGVLRLWIDDVLRDELTGLDNHGSPARIVDDLLGALWSLDDTAGSYAFDDYRACHGPSGRDSVLVDGAEDGTLDAWDSIVTQGGGEISVTAGAALDGIRGFAFRVDPGSQWVELLSDNIDGAAHLFSSFLIDPAGLIIPDGQEFYLFGYTGPGGWRHHLRLGQSGGTFQIRQISAKDGLSWSAGPTIDLAGPGVPQRLGVEWWQASAAGADDGGARLFIDGTLVDERMGLDNDELHVTSLHLGAGGAVPAATQGTFYVDAVQVWKGSGPRRNLLYDGFDGGLSNDWSASIESGGSVTTDAVAALTGSQGLKVEVTPGVTSNIQVQTEVAADARHLGASFLFDPGTFSTPEGSQLYLFGGTQPGNWRFHLRLLFSGGRFQVSLIANLDGTTWATTAFHELADPGTAQRLGVEWWRPSADNANDGGARLSIDGVVVEELLGLDNDEEIFTTLHLGAAALVDDAASGALYLDDVQIWTLDE